MLDREDFSRKGAKAQRNPFKNAAALCAFAPLREKSSRKKSCSCKASARYILPVVIFFLFARTASAHEGPPFPLFVDQKVDRYIVSVWTDPDVGAALFFVIVSV